MSATAPIAEERGPDPPEYMELYTPFTPEELALLPQIKRFFECYEGDKELRDNLHADTVTPQQRALLKEIGITFEVEALAPLWREKDLLAKALGEAPDSESNQAVEAIVKAHPVLDTWVRFKLRKGDLYVQQRSWVTKTASESSKYTAWRRRRIQATKSELGTYGYEIDHPSLAIELAVGCSVGCYFCAFDAKKLEKTFDITVPENRELFRGISASLRDRLGWSSGHALLYWSTEPADNPHYIEFMKEYRAITGSSVCTATARADEKWVADLLAHYRPLNQPWPRISVLTRSIMYKLHKRFTPEEARDMTLLMQQKDSEEQRLKVPGGRDKQLAKLDNYQDLRELETERRPEDMVVPQGSIACVSGFLINIIEKSIRLISPCYTTQEHRYGYRVFDQVSFTDAADFDRQLGDMIERKMVYQPYDGMTMRFRDDLRYRARPDGFQLSTRHQVHQLVGDEIYGPLGALLDAGSMTYAEVVDDLVDNHGFNAMIVTAVIKGMFDEGFLCEMQVAEPAAMAPRGTLLQMGAS
jgi:radical SAM family RiPP maturation amino acid epimerase